MIKFSEILPLLNMDEDVYIYANGDNSYLIFDGVLSALPLDGYLHVKERLGSLKKRENTQGSPYRCEE